MNRQPNPHPSPKGQAPKPPKLPPFTIVKLTPVDTGNLKAFVDIQIGKGPQAFTVLKWRLVQHEGKDPWLSPPQEIFTDATGERRYLNLFVPPKEWIAPITEAAISAWQARTPSVPAQ